MRIPAARSDDGVAKPLVNEAIATITLVRELAGFLRT
jgi:hypothetical protein